ncbi:hypothetical protein C900_05487 [Fulvivirga imtechensis AK7]|uniref:Viral A-type inclusion protein n=1 Tax=Fulvivirga imtechensis AK7 TaxID=1237149 RepID=L8JLG8_9BACT|nr:hypothetical protein [Fulvivirga imtechensis]ELR69098.1 hypothetical protein C900_05487 [Fulvivirga imtechensis AK7]
MKYIQLSILHIMTATILFSCGQKSESDNDDLKIENKEMPAEARAEKALYDEVMAVHDEVMPKMDDMMRLKGRLQTKLDLAREQENQNQEELKTLENAIKQLEEADEAMMQWMRDFEPQENMNDHEKVMGYYKAQKNEIEKVKEQMLNAMKNAQDNLN